jgi:hypothetical protein
MEGIESTNWTFHGNFADQGLLYYWTKYVKKNVSIVVDHEVENWASSSRQEHLEGGGRIGGVGEQVWLEETLDGALDNYTCLPLDKADRGTYGASFPSAYGKAPFRDLFHFVGRTKVWEVRQFACVLCFVVVLVG